MFSKFGHYVSIQRLKSMHVNLANSWLEVASK